MENKLEYNSVNGFSNLCIHAIKKISKDYSWLNWHLIRQSCAEKQYNERYKIFEAEYNLHSDTQRGFLANFTFTIKIELRHASDSDMNDSVKIEFFVNCRLKKYIGNRIRKPSHTNSLYFGETRAEIFIGENQPVTFDCRILFAHIVKKKEDRLREKTYYYYSIYSYGINSSNDSTPLENLINWIKKDLDWFKNHYETMFSPDERIYENFLQVIDSYYLKGVRYYKDY